ncbi:MAG: cobalt-precorrin-5B (C(1))-methyltransferase [Cohaesibacteraceae bacterium]
MGKTEFATDLRFGYTTGACATAATKAALTALLGLGWKSPVEITLPKGQKAQFDLVDTASGQGWARASVKKDAGDDPDVTHGSLIISTVKKGQPSMGVVFKGGDGVGTVTLPGLPIEPGEPAINPVPRKMIEEVINELANSAGNSSDFQIEISVPGGEEIARKTWNPRLGIEGGISILGTTGIVRPFSCAAWIASIHRGVDVARANGAIHAVGSTGATSESTAQAMFGLPDWAMLDMGDFAGGLLKYVRRHPVSRLTIAGGFGKLTKLAQGAMDLHSARSQVDFAFLASLANDQGIDPGPINEANTAMEALSVAGPLLAEAVAQKARHAAIDVLGTSETRVDVLVVARDGTAIAMADQSGSRVL